MPRHINKYNRKIAKGRTNRPRIQGQQFFNEFKDMDVDVKDWNFSVGKMEKEYIVQVNLKLGIRSKKP